MKSDGVGVKRVGCDIDERPGFITIGNDNAQLVPRACFNFEQTAIPLVTTGEQGPPNASRRKWWQFTLREWFFFVIAVAAILALISQHRPFRITPFFDSFDERKIIRTACDKLQLNCVIRGYGGGFHTGHNSAVRRSETTLEIPNPADRHRVIGQMRKELEAVLHEHGCHIHGHGHSGDIKKDELSEFNFDYERGNSQGDVWVESYYTGNAWWSVRIMMHEFKK